MQRLRGTPLSHGWLAAPPRTAPFTTAASAALRQDSRITFSSAACARTFVYTKQRPQQLAKLLPLRATRLRTSAAMALHDEKHEWGATRVRDTFLDYFKERGHTFGEFSLFHPSTLRRFPRHGAHEKSSN